MSRCYKITFSPTGTSRKVAEWIAEAFGQEAVFLDLCGEIAGEIQTGRNDVCVFSVPCYGGRIPQTAAERLSRIRGADTPAIVCVTFGNRAFEDALLELADCVEAGGFQVVAGCAVSTEHNIMHVFGQGRPDDLDQEEIRRFSVEVAQKVRKGGTNRPAFPGSRPYKERHASKTAILVDENTCVSCGLCAQKCPVKAISPDGRRLDEDACINCMRCIQICPNKSRSLPEPFVAALIQRLSGVCAGRKENEFYD